MIIPNRRLWYRVCPQDAAWNKKAIDQRGDFANIGIDKESRWTAWSIAN
jgi:hypothetical protein